MMISESTNPEELRRRAERLGLHGLLADWEQRAAEPWLPALLALEEAERQRRSLERRLHHAKLGRFKPLADFDWSWPKKIDRAQIEELFTLRFLEDATNVILVGPNGVGKTLIAQNLAYHAVLHGHTVRFLTAAELLSDLAAQETASALQRRLRRHLRPQLIFVDELGYLSYDHRHADLLFEVVSRRYTHKSIVLTTNKPFGEWNEVFPQASCVVSLIDRLVHHAEIVVIEADSYRLKEAQEREALRLAQRKAARRRSSRAS
jgi:DNA replication protein DnaC